MENPILFCEHCTERALYEDEDKGYKNDVYVYLNNSYYKISVYHTVRLIQDFQFESDSTGYFTVEPNLILVTSVTPECVYKTVSHLVRKKFFDALKATDVSGIKLYPYIRPTQ